MRVWKMRVAFEITSKVCSLLDREAAEEETWLLDFGIVHAFSPARPTGPRTQSKILIWSEEP
jgi:hypothetical protein